MYVKPVVLVLTAVLALGAAATASADPADRTPIPPPSDQISTGCGFPVLVEYVEWNVISTTFSSEASPLVEIQSGVAKVRLTNLETGESIELNISGPLTLQVFADGSTVESRVGPWLFVDVPPGQGVPPLFLSEGRVTFTFDAAGNLTIASSGRVVDLCAQLAA